MVRRDLSACDRMPADDYVDHEDLRFVIEETVTLGRHVAVQASWRGIRRKTGASSNKPVSFLSA
jgi:hypothetical protein